MGLQLSIDQHLHVRKLWESGERTPKRTEGNIFRAHTGLGTVCIPPVRLRGEKKRVSAVVQWVKDPALLQWWHRSQLQFRFDPWPGNFHMLQCVQKRKKKKRFTIHEAIEY